MKKILKKIVKNEKNPENVDVYYKFIGKEFGSFRYLFPEKKLSNVPIKDIFKGQTAIEDIEIDKRAFAGAEIDTLVIPGGVTAIPDACFRASKITTLTLPSTLSTIGIEAFAEAAIDILAIPEGVTALPKYCFRAANITTLQLPSTLSTIDISAFAGAEIDTLEIPGGVTAIPDACFKASKINKLQLPSALSTIGIRTFAGAEIDTLE
ncbi:MAG: hypothetical protein CMF42_00165, partial [Legionellales bacterium]|nr:hypothetical protein [Legionellales bacterium]